MISVAVIKHIASKNADYGESERYLIFQHNEYTQKPILDDKGHMILRDESYLDGLNCDPFTFASECQELNSYYHKNKNFNEIKSHHYIISFDPRDAADNGLSVDRAQQLGEQFCKEHFPGHQAIVCTHPDGHNHSGNIHVHIVINSLRIEEVPFLPYMDRPADTRTGFNAENRPEVEVKDLAAILQKDELFQDYLENNRRKVQSAFQLPDLYTGCRPSP